MLDPNTSFEQFAQLLPPNIEALAREFKAFTFGRKIKTPAQLLHVVFLYCGLDLSLRETAAHFTLLHQKITDSSIHERLCACQPWLKALLGQMLPIPRDCESIDFNWIVCDGSKIKGLASEGVEYRLHVAINLRTLEITQVKLTDRYTGESLQVYDFGKGDAIIADKGYFHYKQIRQVTEDGADVVIRFRYKAGQIYQPGCEQTLDLEKIAKKYEEHGSFSIPIEFGIKSEAKRISGYLHGRKMPEEQANAARMRLNKKAKGKKGKWSPSSEALYLAGWVLVFTTIPPEKLSAELTFKLYRCRWQIELVFKRWKSLLHMEPLKVKLGSQLAEVYLLGKLIYALVLDKKVRALLPEGSLELGEERSNTFWRAWKLMQEESRVWLVGGWKKENMTDALEVLQERKRKRTLQTLPTELLSSMGEDLSPAAMPSLQRAA